MIDSPIFVSLDIETFGPIPGRNPMVELGAAAFQIDGTVKSTWRATLDPLDWQRESATMKWWHMPKQYPKFRELLDGDQQHPEHAMISFITWVQELGDSTPVAYPAGFDYMFVYWYLHHYVGFSQPWSFSCIDIKSYVMGALKNDSYKRTVKRSFPKEWFHPNLKHTHGALDDALEQGWTFIQAHRVNLGLGLLDPNNLKLDG